MINKLSVIGAGQMGTGIAQIAAQVAKIPQIILFDKSSDQLKAQFTKMKESLERAKQKGSISQDDLEFTLSAIKTSSNLKDLNGSKFIIEVKLCVKLTF
jgi:3-hydroxybutyryl-CoA dehydrogenase